MARELLILRHGKSDWDMNTDDFNRPLKDRGKRGAQRMATWLLRQGLVPDYVLASPAERAIETARKACKAMGLAAKDVHTDRAIYLASEDALLAVLATVPTTAKRVMLVGHNPGLEDLLLHLGGRAVTIPADGKLLPTATLAHLAMPDQWGELPEGCAELKNLMRPAALPKKFPFPLPEPCGEGGGELRDRPAYYYRQSSVIPFRVTDGAGVEILVIDSSKNHHSVVPKGIHDPGLSPQESAAKEAWEEAGVEGEVLDQPLGEYRYEKWGAECTVTVYPMRVERMVPEAEWKESHRGRRWLSPEEAATDLKQRDLAPMVLDLAEQMEN